jgi:hypothetical protein
MTTDPEMPVIPHLQEDNFFVILNCKTICITFILGSNSY